MQGMITIYSASQGLVHLCNKTLSFPETRKELLLTKKQNLIFHGLMHAHSGPVSKADLMEAIGWNPDMLRHSHTIHTHIWRIRQALDAIGATRFIRSESGGYRIV